jgi:SAM-dependent methyltransferase
LACIYDDFHEERDDLDAYEALVHELGARSVLDIGCGTGTFACRLAAAGLEVIGVDPAAASLDIARGKPDGATVTWLDGDATDLPSLHVDLATMTGNVAQVFLTDDEWTATLRGARRAVRTGGHLVFETRDPAREGWRAWTREETLCRVDIAALGPVECWVHLTDVALPFVSFRWTYRIERTGESLVSDSTLRFRGRAEIEASLDDAGFEVADVRDAPDRPGLELVFVARAVG